LRERHIKKASVFVWLVVGAVLFQEKNTVSWLVVIGLFCDKSTTGLVADKLNEQVVSP
jgi:hypothetical protein